MDKLFLRLLGVPAEHAQRIADGHLRLRGEVTMGWLVLAALALGTLVIFMYRRAAPEIAAWKKYTLAALRTIFLVLILAMLTRPVLEIMLESTVRRELVILVDVSTSMKIEDPRTQEDDKKRVAIARGVLDPARGLNQSLLNSEGLTEVARLDLARTILRSGKIDLYNRLAREYNIDTFTFSDVVAEQADGSHRHTAEGSGGAGVKATPLKSEWIDKLNVDKQQTALGDAIRGVVARKRGQPMAGILVVTDGANNTGADPRGSANLAGEGQMPLWIYGVGIERPKNLEAGNLFAPEVSFVDDQVLATLRVKSQGVAGAKVSLKLVDAAGIENEVDQKEIKFDTDNEMVVPLKFMPKTKGEYKLKASVEPTDGSIELIKTDNQATQPLTIIDSKVKVLVIDQTPRWEFKYLQAVVGRDRRLDAKFYLVEGSAGLAQGPGSPYLDKFPENKKDLLAYDLIVLGDVDPAILTKERLEMIQSFVGEFGGGLVIMAGKKNMPWAYRRTALEAMLPVEIETGVGAGTGAEEIFDAPVKIELTAAGKRAPMLKLHTDDLESERLWTKLPPIFWVAPVSRPKPAAEVLMVDATAPKGARAGRTPILALQVYSRGQVLWMGTDNTWRWRRNKGDDQYITFWSQVVQRMALPHLLGGTKRTQIEFDKREYVTGEKVRIFARLYSEAYQPLTRETHKEVKAYVSRTGVDDPLAREVILRPHAEQPGMFLGEFVATDDPGISKVYVELDKAVVRDLVINEPKVEPGEQSLQVEVLDGMAKSSGGKLFREESLMNLPDVIRKEAPKIHDRLPPIDLWASPLYFILLLGVVTAEWIMRKMCQLK